MDKPKGLVATIRTNKAAIAILVIATALFYNFAPSRWVDEIAYTMGSSPLGYIAIIAAIAIPAIAVLFLIHKPKNIIGSMGLNRNFAFAFLLGFLFSIPLLISIFLIEDVTISNDWFQLVLSHTISNTLLQFFIIGFLFGQLFRYAGWGFTSVILLYTLITVIPAIASNGNNFFNAPMFVQGMSAMLLFYAFYFWLYVEWRYNIWVPVCLSFFIAIPTDVFFAYADIETSNLIYDVALLLTAVAAIVATIVYKKRNKIPFTITAQNLLVNKQTEAC